MHIADNKIPPFFTLVFILSIPFWILDAIYPIELLPGLPLSALAVLVPTLAACILVYRSDSLVGVLQLFRRALDFNRVPNTKWLLVAVLINPVIAVLAFGIMRATGVAVPNPRALPVTVFILFIIFFVSAVAEEIGWTGYATDLLLQRWGLITASILLGVIWSLWHFIPLLQVHRSFVWIAWWSLWTISLRLIMGWLYIHSGRSTFVASIFHAMINLCWQLFPVNGSFYDPRVFGLITFGFAIVVLWIEQIRMKSSVQAIPSS
jgi:membrane protease YdiL (CAAX protease family)